MVQGFSVVLDDEHAGAAFELGGVRQQSGRGRRPMSDKANGGRRRPRQARQEVQSPWRGPRSGRRSSRGVYVGLATITCAVTFHRFCPHLYGASRRSWPPNDWPKAGVMEARGQERETHPRTRARHLSRYRRACFAEPHQRLSIVSCRSSPTKLPKVGAAGPRVRMKSMVW